MAGQRLAEGARRGRVAHIPQPHRLIVAGAGEGGSVRGERHRPHGAGVAGQRCAERAPQPAAGSLSRPGNSTGGRPEQAASRRGWLVGGGADVVGEA